MIQKSVINKTKSKLTEHLKDLRCHPNNMIYIVTCGTGSGKSFSTFKSFDNMVTEMKTIEDNRCVFDFFIAPLKSHLNDGNIEETFENKDIRIVKVDAGGDYFVYRKSNVFNFIKNSKDLILEIQELNKKFINLRGKFTDFYNSKIGDKETKYLLNGIYNLDSKINNLFKLLREKNILDKDNSFNESFKEIPFEMIDEIKGAIDGYQFQLIENVGNFIYKGFYERVLGKDIELQSIFCELMESFISRISPLSFTNFHKYIIFKMTFKKSISPQSLIVLKGKDISEEDSDTKIYSNNYESKTVGNDLYDTLISQQKKNNIFNNVKFNDSLPKINIHYDEADTIFSQWKEELITQSELNINIPDFFSSFFSYLGNFENEEVVEVYDFVNKYKSYPKMVNVINYIKKELKSIKDEDKRNKKNISGEKDTLKKKNEIKFNKKDYQIWKKSNPKESKIVEKIVNEFNSLSYESLLETSRLYKLMISKIKLFDLSYEKLIQIIEMSKINTKKFSIEKSLYNEISNQIETIFFKQGESIYLSKKEELSSLFIKYSDSIEKKIIVVKNGNPEKDISLYEYLMTFLLSAKLTPKIAKTITENSIKEINNKDIVAHTELKCRGINRVGIETIIDIIEQNETFLEINKEEVFEKDKLLLILKESNGYKNTSSDKYINISLDVEISKSSPEDILFNTSNNYEGELKIFLISATTGWKLDYITQVDLNYLKNCFEQNGNNDFMIEDPTINKINDELAVVRKKDEINFYQFKYNNLLEQRSKIFKDFYSNINKQLSGIPLVKYKNYELQNIVDSISKLKDTEKYNAMLVLTQTTKHFRKAIDSMISNSIISSQDGVYPVNYDDKFAETGFRIYKLKIVKDKKVEIVNCILYKSKIEERFNSIFKDKKFKDILHTIQNEKKEKVIVITDYLNGSIGLNFKQTQTINDVEVEKDFDTIVFAMDPFFEYLSKNKGSKLKDEDMKLRFILNEGLSNHYKFDNLDEIEGLKTYSEFKSFINAVYRIKQQIQQPIGRSERSDNNRFIDIYFSNETIMKTIAAFDIVKNYKNGEDLNQITNASPTNRSFYEFINECKNEWILSEKDKEKVEKYQFSYVNIINKEIDNLLSDNDNFKKGKDTNKEIVYKWELLRDSSVLFNIEDYLLKMKNSGLFSDTFIEGLFVENHNYKKIDDLEKKKLQYYDSENSNILTDMKMIKDTSNIIENKIYNMLRIKQFFEYSIDENDIELKEMFNYFNKFDITGLIEKKPIYDFFQRIISGCLLEHLTTFLFKQRISQSEDNVKLYEVDDLIKHNILLEAFDIYIETEDTFYCIDCKNYGVLSDKKHSQSTIDKKLEQKRLIEEYFKNIGKELEVEIVFIKMNESDKDSSVSRDEFSTASLFCVSDRFGEKAISISKTLEKSINI